MQTTDIQTNKTLAQKIKEHLPLILIVLIVIILAVIQILKLIID